MGALVKHLGGRLEPDPAGDSGRGAQKLIEELTNTPVSLSVAKKVLHEDNPDGPNGAEAVFLQYALLPRCFRELKTKDPAGTYVLMQEAAVTDVHSFHRYYICPSAVRDLQRSMPITVATWDVTWAKIPFRASIWAFTYLDADGRILPLAVGYASGSEDGATARWMAEHFRHDYPGIELLLSDQGTGVTSDTVAECLQGVTEGMAARAEEMGVTPCQEVLPGYCVRHLAEHFKSRHRSAGEFVDKDGKAISKAESFLWQFSLSRTPGWGQRIIEQAMDVSVAMATELEKLAPMIAPFARLGKGRSDRGIKTTAHSESLNSLLVDSRCKGPASILHWLMAYWAEAFEQRAMKARAFESNVTDYAQAKRADFIKTCHGLYEVDKSVNMAGTVFHVWIRRKSETTSSKVVLDIDPKHTVVQCPCLHFEQCGFPCKRAYFGLLHILGKAHRQHIFDSQFIDKMFLKESYLQAYEGRAARIPNMDPLVLAQPQAQLQSQMKQSLLKRGESALELYPPGQPPHSSVRRSQIEKKQRVKERGFRRQKSATEMAAEKQRDDQEGAKTTLAMDMSLENADDEPDSVIQDVQDAQDAEEDGDVAQEGSQSLCLDDVFADIPACMPTRKELAALDGTALEEETEGQKKKRKARQCSWCGGEAHMRCPEADYTHKLKTLRIYRGTLEATANGARLLEQYKQKLDKEGEQSPDSGQVEAGSLYIVGEPLNLHLFVAKDKAEHVEPVLLVETPAPRTNATTSAFLQPTASAAVVAKEKKRPAEMTKEEQQQWDNRLQKNVREVIEIAGHGKKEIVSVVRKRYKEEGTPKPTKTEVVECLRKVANWDNKRWVINNIRSNLLDHLADKEDAKGTGFTNDNTGKKAATTENEGVLFPVVKERPLRNLLELMGKCAQVNAKTTLAFKCVRERDGSLSAIHENAKVALQDIVKPSAKASFVFLLFDEGQGACQAYVVRRGAPSGTTLLHLHLDVSVDVLTQGQIAVFFECSLNEKGRHRVWDIGISKAVSVSLQCAMIDADALYLWRLALERHEKLTNSIMVYDSLQVQRILQKDANIAHLPDDYDRTVAEHHRKLNGRKEIVFVITTHPNGTHFFVGHIHFGDRSVRLYDSLERLKQHTNAVSGDRSLNRVQEDVRSRVLNVVAFFERLGRVTIPQSNIRYGACHQQGPRSNDCATYSWAAVELLLQGKAVSSSAMPHGRYQEEEALALRLRLAHRIVLGSLDETPLLGWDL